MNKKYIIYIILFFFSVNISLTLADTKYLIINKSNRELIVFLEDGLKKKFSISLGFEPYGKKIKKGDGKTPEGLYFIEKKFKIAHFIWH